MKTGHQSGFQRLEQHGKGEDRSGGAANLLRSCERTGKTLATRPGRVFASCSLSRELREDLPPKGGVAWRAEERRRAAE